VTFLSDPGNGFVLLRWPLMFRWVGLVPVLVLAVWIHGAEKTAHASIADWRINEILPAQDQNDGIRYVELYVPPGTTGNCLFPTTRLEVFDAQGLLLGAVMPFASTFCLPGGSFFVFATPAAATHFGLTADAPLGVALPAFAGQVCFASSATRYDCARWGPISEAVGYLRALDDTSSAPTIPDGQALARIGDSGVVAHDFILETPTPGRLNDGTPYRGPDAGPPPDAAVVADAAVPDARVFARPDAPPFTRPDALVDPRFLSADPGGGGLGCQTAPGRPGGTTTVTLLGLLGRAAWRRRAGLRAGDRASGRAACRCPR
jgi:hypothetical protein